MLELLVTVWLSGQIAQERILEIEDRHAVPGLEDSGTRVIVLVAEEEKPKERDSDTGTKHRGSGDHP